MFWTHGILQRSAGPRQGSDILSPWEPIRSPWAPIRSPCAPIRSPWAPIRSPWAPAQTGKIGSLLPSGMQTESTKIVKLKKLMMKKAG